MKRKLIAFTTIVLIVSGSTAFKPSTRTPGFYRNGNWTALEPVHNSLIVRQKPASFKANSDVIVKLIEERFKNGVVAQDLLHQGTNYEGACYRLTLDHDVSEDLLAELRKDASVAYVGKSYRIAGEVVSPDGQIHLRLNDELSITQLKTILAEVGASFKSLHRLGNIRYAVATTQTEDNLFQATRVLVDDYNLDLAEPNFYFTAQTHTAPNDTYFSTQWWLENAITPTADIEFISARSLQVGSSEVTVAVFDLGFDVLHEDIASSIYNPFNAVDSNSSTAPWNSFDRHGTPCMGIIGALNNNSLGVASVAGGVKVMPVIIGNNPTGSGSFSSSTIYFLRAAEWVINQPDVVAVSNSIGFGAGGFSEALADYYFAMQTQARNGKGAVILASTGNDGINQTGANAVQYPMAYPNVIGVGATTSSDALASFSNAGNFCDITAPGVGVITIDRMGSAGYNGTTPSDNNYTSFGGTSAACPVVAGVVGLVASVNPDFTATELAAIVQTNTDKVTVSYTDTRDFGTWEYRFGYGRVNAYKSVQAALATSNDSRVASQQASFRLFPSPVRDRVTIELLDSAPQAGTLEITIVGIDGKRYQTVRLQNVGNQRVYSFPVESSPAGLGLVEVKVSGKSMGSLKTLFVN